MTSTVSAARRVLSILIITLVPASVTLALQVTGLQQPTGSLVDPATDAYYIANVNGGPSDRDNNGFITKLDRSGKIVKLKFIEGGTAGVTLHAPKGLAVVDQKLYVSDIDRVRCFDAVSGRPAGEIDFTEPHADFLTGMTTDGRGILYIADSGTNTIFKVLVRASGQPQVLVKDALLAGPHGLAINPRTGSLVAVSWNAGSILEITPSGAVKVLFANSFFSARFGNLMGVDFDAYGNMYVSDYSQGKIARIDPGFRIQTIAEFLPTPAGLSIDRQNHVILVPYVSGNVLEINGLGPNRR